MVSFGSQFQNDTIYHGKKCILSGLQTQQAWCVHPWKPEDEHGLWMPFC